MYVLIGHKDKRTYGPFNSDDKAKEFASTIIKNVKWKKYGVFYSKPLWTSKNGQWQIVPESYIS